MFKRFSVSAVIALVCIHHLSHAQLIEWKDNIPSSLQPFQNNAQQLANITQDRIVIFSHPSTKTSIPTLTKNPNPAVSFSSSAIVLPVSSEVVAKTLANHEQYVGLFPTLKFAKLLEKSGNISQMKYKVSIPTPIPVLNFHEDIIFQHQINNNSLSSLVIDAPIPYGIGKLEWFRLGDHKTLLTLTQWGDLNQPRGFLFKKILNAIPEAKLGIPSGTNAFILESLRKKFAPNKVLTLAAGQYPTPQLSKQQLDLIAQVSKNAQQPVSFINPAATVPYQHGLESMRFVTTYQYYAKSPQQLQKWTQPNSYQSLFPRQIKSIKTSDLVNNNQNADFKVSVGLGVITIPFDFKLNFKYPSNTANEFYANGGDLKFLKGQMNFDDFQQGTLLKMTSAVKIDDQAPFLLRAVRSLPYNDVLPTVGANVVFAQKIRTLK